MTSNVAGSKEAKVASTKQENERRKKSSRQEGERKETEGEEKLTV